MEIKNLTKIYKTQYELVKALNDMSLTFPQRGLVFIVGVSGSGKSTLMNMLSGVDTPSSGEVVINGKSLFVETQKQLFGYRNSYVGLIFQDYNLIEDINVYENIKLPLTFLGIKDYSIIDEVIKKVDIEDIKYSKVTEISSGQMQRVAIARALVKDSAMILADEPTGNLDSKNTKIVMDLLKEISQDRLVIVITHDDEAAHEYGDRVIAIEDGTILSDDIKNEEINTYRPDLEKNLNFIKPIINTSQQIKFTLGFIRNSLLRSLAIFVMLILIPVIGSVLCGYAFFDVSVSYKEYQEKYGSEYVMFSAERSGNSVYFNVDQYMEMFDKYGIEELYEIFSIYVPLIQDEDDISPFYQPVIKNMIVDDTNRITYLDGEAPSLVNEIGITDYISESYAHYTGEFLQVGDTLSLAGNAFIVSGIIETSFRDYLHIDMNDNLKRTAFEENLYSYNAVYTTSAGYTYFHNNSKYFVEEMTFTLMPQVSKYPVPVKKTALVAVRNEKLGIPGYKYGNATSFANMPANFGLLSQGLWEGIMEFSSAQIGQVNSVTLVCSTTTRYNVSVRVGYIYSSTLNLYGIEGEIVVHQSLYNKYIAKQEGSRFLIHSSSPVYKEVIEEEYITNPSFSYARATWIRAESSKYVMFEFLITLLIIMMVFSFIINSMTLRIEKKKIGIKYSFGISKLPIVVPYVLEIFLYIFSGIIISTFAIKLLMPIIMTSLVYTSPQELLEYEFFYIATNNIIVWDVIVYTIMVSSLLTMILSICRKSPIEIIKDL